MGQREVLLALRELGGQAHVQEIHALTVANGHSCHPSLVNRSLAKLIGNGEVRRVSKGVYALEERS